MALETLKDVKKIGGYEVTGGVSNFGANRPVLVHHESNQIAFQIQNGPVKEVGVNGCQVDTVIHAAKTILVGLDAKYPSPFNKNAIINLNLAIESLEMRTKDREQRNVEGTSQH